MLRPMVQTQNDDDDEPWLDRTPDKPPAKAARGAALWVVHIGQPVGARRGRAEGFICVGWTEAGDLSLLGTRDKLKRAFDKHYPDHPSMRVANWAGDALRFIDMRRGEMFVFPVKGEDEILVGEIVGEHRFRPDDQELMENDSANTRPVKWLGSFRRSEFSEEARKCFDSEHTVHSGADHRDEVLKLLLNAQGKGG